MCRILKKQDSYSCLRPRTQILTQDETFKGFGFGHACYGLMLSYSPTYVLHLVLPNLKLYFLDADIFIKVHSSLTMFSLNMIDYPMSFITLPTWKYRMRFSVESGKEAVEDRQVQHNFESR